jgi:hypothetical protein
VFNFQPVEFNGPTHLSLMVSRASDESLSAEPILGAEEEDDTQYILTEQQFFSIPPIKILHRFR